MQGFKTGNLGSLSEWCYYTRCPGGWRARLTENIMWRARGSVWRRSGKGRKGKVCWRATKMDQRHFSTSSSLWIPFFFVFIHLLFFCFTCFYVFFPLLLDYRFTILWTSLYLFYAGRTRVTANKGYSEQGLQQTRVTANKGYSEQGLQRTKVTVNKGYNKQGLQQTRVTANKAYSEQGIQQTRVTANKGYSKQGLQRTRVTVNKGYSEQGLQRTRITANKGYSE